jgi:DNA topoisomerase-1
MTSKKLVIVESPAKARTIGGYLGPEFVVESSVGHIRDIPSKVSEVPERQKDAWRRSRFGIDIDHGFAPLYVVNPDSKKQVTKLKKLLKDADEVYLATDEDREGEAIAWHLLEVLKPKVPVRRMVFHEITPEAIAEAVEHPRELDRRLVRAQEARRVLDRLFGYEVSPVLWRKVQRGLSAGRVQSPAIRILVEREQERMRFVVANYAGVKGTFSAGADGLPGFEASLRSVDGRRVATGKDFGSDGVLSGDRLVLDTPAAEALVGELGDASFSVRSVERKPYTRKPAAPFRTATLQQEAGRKMRFGSRRTMAAAQRLYEGGYITYMRTDSTTLSEAALAAARALVSDRYGPEFVPAKPRTYGKARSAQEAHEAIRPAGEQFHDPADAAAAFGPKSDEARLYDLIWKRTVASQMKDAKGESLQVRLGALAPASGRDCEFSASGRTITFPGFMRAYVEGSDDPDAALEDRETHLPDVSPGDPLHVVAMEASSHETKPPARYTEASLVKRLEELGIGRPSTYASIISTILDRDYAAKQGTALVPTLRAFAVVRLLEDAFSDYVDYDFTARMEEDLDQIAGGNAEPVPWLEGFYFGDGYPGLSQLVSDEALEKIDPRVVNAFPVGEDSEGTAIVARCGQYGPYLVRGDERASIPVELPPDQLTVEAAIELLAAGSDEKILGTDPDSGFEVLARSGRFGPYVQLGERDEEANPKPRTASLFKTMSMDSVSLDQALELLTLPRVVGPHPDDGADITAQNGRYGPYVKWGSETRSLETEEQIFGISLDRAVRLLAEPRRRRSRNSGPLRELGEDPGSGKPVVVKEGRWGPYVTDGEYNASLKSSDTVEHITLERAADLLQARRDRGPAKKRKS